MRVFLKEVIIGNVDDSSRNENIIDFWITGELQSGRKIVIIDDDLFDLRNYEGKWIECLIAAAEGTEDVKEIIKGVFLNEYKIPLKENYILPQKLEYLNISKEQYLIKRPAIKTEDGIFLIYPSKKFKDKQKINFYVAEYKLIAWLPIEE